MSDAGAMDAGLEQLFEFLRFPSVSTDPAHRDDVSACGEWVYRKFASMGLEAAVHGTPGHPVILARGERREGRPTVLIYGHYDVQPADPLDLWTSPPFEPRLADGIITARGAADNKGQIMAHILGVEAALAGGELPVNVIFLVEGEEEIGSPNLGAFLREHAEELGCDVIVISDSTMIGPGVPTLTYGLRGLGCIEVWVTGPGVDLHSGIYGGIVQNPIMALARMLATLHRADGGVAIPGFYDAVMPLQEWERAGWAKLPLTEGRLLEITGAPALAGAFGGEVALIREGGSIPIVQSFKEILGVDTLLLGLALPDCKAHSPNENFPVANFEAGIRLNQGLLREIGQAGRACACG